MKKILFRPLTIEYSYMKSNALTYTNPIKVNLNDHKENVTNSIKLYIPDNLDEINIINNIYYNINNISSTKIKGNTFLFCIDFTIFVLYSDSNLKSNLHFVREKIYFKKNSTLKFPKLHITKYRVINYRCISISFSLET